MSVAERAPEFPGRQARKHPECRVAVIWNDRAGSVQDSAARTIAGVLEAAGVDARIEAVPGALAQAAAEHAIRDGFSIVAAAGGDGTVNAVASAVAGTAAVLGVLPVGTLNHFAKDLGVPLPLDRATETILHGRTVRVDAGEVNGRLFLNNSSLGTYPSLLLEREQQRRGGRHKWLAHGVAALRVWQRYRRVHVEYEMDRQRRTVLTPFVFVGNNEYTLEGTKIGSRERLHDGHLQVCMAPGMSRVDVIRTLAAALAGRLDGVERFEVIRASEFAIHARRRRLLVSLDGELAVLETPLRYRVRPGVLRIRVPAPTVPSVS